MKDEIFGNNQFFNSQYIEVKLLILKWVVNFLSVNTYVRYHRSWSQSDDQLPVARMRRGESVGSPGWQVFSDNQSKYTTLMSKKKLTSFHTKRRLEKKKTSVFCFFSPALGFLSVRGYPPSGAIPTLPLNSIRQDDVSIHLYLISSSRLFITDTPHRQSRSHLSCHNAFICASCQFVYTWIVFWRINCPIESLYQQSVHTVRVVTHDYCNRAFNSKSLR